MERTFTFLRAFDYMRRESSIFLFFFLKLYIYIYIYIYILYVCKLPFKGLESLLWGGFGVIIIYNGINYHYKGLEVIIFFNVSYAHQGSIYLIKNTVKISGGWSIGGAAPIKLAREEAEFNMFKNKFNIYCK